jgi:hypothetical protein
MNNILHQGYLQFFSSGQEAQSQKGFVTVSLSEIAIFAEDPSKDSHIRPLLVVNPNKVQIKENGEFQRPKSFSLVTENGQSLEFSCPTNSVRSSWLKSLTEVTALSSQRSAPMSASQFSGNNRSNNPDLFRTPVAAAASSSSRTSSQAAVSSHYRASNPNSINNSNRFSDFDGFANSTLSQLNSLKGNNPSLGRNPDLSSTYGSSSQPSSSYLAQPQPHIAQPKIRKAFGATTTSTAKRQTNSSSTNNPKELPRWVPGHFKKNLGTDQQNKAAVSPQRARGGPAVNNVYSYSQTFHSQQQQQQQHAPHSPPSTTLLTRSVSAPASRPPVGAVPHYMQSVHSLHHHQQDNQQHHYSQQAYPQAHPQAHHQLNPVGEESIDHIPLEKMTLQQLRKAFQSMPNEIRVAITGSSTSNQQQALPSLRHPSEKEAVTNSRRSSSNRGSRSSGQHSDEKKQRAPMPKPSLSRREQFSPEESQVDDEHNIHDHYNQQHYHEETEEEHLSPAHEEDEGNDNDTDNENQQFDYYEFRKSANHDNTSNRNIAARLDYVDYSDDEEEQHKNHYVKRGTTHSRGDDKMKKFAAKVSSSKAYQNKPPLTRSRSAPPSSTQRKQTPTSQSSPTKDLFSSKAKSSIPRQDLLEWSKQKAWQKQVTTGFPLAKEVYKTYKDQPGTTATTRKEEPSSKAINKQSPRAYEESLLKRTNSLPLSTVPASNKPTRNKSIKSLQPSFFDFMKTRGATTESGADVFMNAMNQAPDWSNQMRKDQNEPAEEEKKTTVNTLTKKNLSMEQLYLLHKNKNEFPNNSVTAGINGVNNRPVFSPSMTQKLAKSKFSPPPPPAAAAGRREEKKAIQRKRSDSGSPSPAPSPDEIIFFTRSKDENNSVSSHSLKGGERGGKLVRTPSNASFPDLGEANGTLTDVAEFQRLTNWLTSIKMEKYIPNFREHGVTKLSLIELLGQNDLWNLGIFPDDIPFIQRKVAEFSQRIRSFTEESAADNVKQPVNGKVSGKEAVARKVSTKEGEKRQPKAFFPSNMEEANNEMVLGTSFVLQHQATERKSYPSITDIETFMIDIMKSFDESNYSSFIVQWERFLYNHLLPEMITMDTLTATSQQEQQQQQTQQSQPHPISPTSPMAPLPPSVVSLSAPVSPIPSSSFSSSLPHKSALYYAKQAIEFHIYVYFYVSSIRKGLNKEDCTITKHALKSYLERLTLQYDTSLNGMSSGNSSGGGGGEGKEKINGDNSNSHLDDSLLQPQQSPKPLISSREFATFAGLVFVPNPQQNPAFQTLFREEWTQALRQRLQQFISLLFEESKKHNSKLLQNSRDELEEEEQQGREEQQQQEEKREEVVEKQAILKTPSRSLSIENPATNDYNYLKGQVETKNQRNDNVKDEKAINSLVINTAGISPIQNSVPPSTSALPLTTSNVAAAAAAATSISQQPQSNLHLQYTSFDHHLQQNTAPPGPPESPVSEGSIISQLTDDTDTPIHHHHHIHSSQNQQQRGVTATNGKLPLPGVIRQPVSSTLQARLVYPSNYDGKLAPSQVPGVSSTNLLANNGNNKLTEAANRANLKLKMMQNDPSAILANGSLPHSTVPVGSGNIGKRSGSSSPPKSTSLQLQVDNYNKLLKQHKLNKTTVAAPVTTASVSRLHSSSSDHPHVENQQEEEKGNDVLSSQKNALLEEMNHPENKELLSQIDAIIAPINLRATSSSSTSIPSSATTPSTNIQQTQLPQPPSSLPSHKFNLGVHLPANPNSSSTEDVSLTDQVNRYKSLLKAKPSSFSNAPITVDENNVVNDNVTEKEEHASTSQLRPQHSKPEQPPSDNVLLDSTPVDYHNEDVTYPSFVENNDNLTRDESYFNLKDNLQEVGFLGKCSEKKDDDISKLIHTVNDNTILPDEEELEEDLRESITTDDQQALNDSEVVDQESEQKGNVTDFVSPSSKNKKKKKKKTANK